MKYKVRKVKSVRDLLKALQEQAGESGAPVWYRGQARSEWPLEPKLMRLTNRLPETHYFNRFKQDASFILQTKPRTDFEWMFLMQHYGFPTRLLDWSESPLVASYFAVSNEQGYDGALWMLLPTVLNAKSRYRSEYRFEIPSFEDVHLENYNPTTIAGESKSMLLPMAAIAPRNSTRMQAQQGVFTITHRENIKVEEAGEPPYDHIWKYEIPTAAKPGLLNELKILGINKFRLFPELDSLFEDFK